MVEWTKNWGAQKEFKIIRTAEKGRTKQKEDKCEKAGKEIKLARTSENASKIQQKY